MQRLKDPIELRAGKIADGLGWAIIKRGGETRVYNGGISKKSIIRLHDLIIDLNPSKYRITGKFDRKTLDLQTRIDIIG